MFQAQVGGQLQVRDPATGQPANGKFWGTVHYQAAADASAQMPHFTASLTNAIKNVLSEKLAANQVAIPTIQASLPHFIPEIIAQSGAQNFGIQVTQLDLQVQVENPSAVQAYSGPMPPTPQQAMQDSFAQAAKDRLDPSNYNVKAKFNVGGFKINASTDGGLDTDGLKNQVKDKAKSTLIWWGIGCFIIFLVFIGLAILGWYIYSEAQSSMTPGGKAPTGEAKTSDWDGSTPFTCGGSDNYKIENVTAKLSGTAITAGANCHLTLVNCTIDADTGISALGNSVITVTGGSVTGKTKAASALGSAQITFSGTKVEGKTSALGSGAKITGP